MNMMAKFSKSILVVSTLFLSLVLCANEPATTPAPKTHTTPASHPDPSSMIPAPPSLSAKSYILMDALSDYVIAEQDVDQRVEPASLTKMMTVYVLDHSIKKGKVKLTDEVPISENAWRATGSRMFVDVNTKVPLEQLLKGIIVQSGNDASIAVAEYIGGSESAFAEIMNFYAKQLGMANTHFTNSTGLPDPNHYTSARDMALLAQALIRDFPETYKLYSLKEYTFKDIKQDNRNRLLWRNECVDGIKTGFTDSAGFCLVASGLKDNMRLISVVMGTKSDKTRVEETNKLLTYGFQFFESRKLYPAATALKTSRIWLGKQNTVDLGLDRDLYVTIGHGQYDRLKADINVEKTIKAPAEQGTVLGSIAVKLDDKTIVERPIIALTEVPKGNFFSRMYDSIALAVYNMFYKLIPSTT